MINLKVTIYKVARQFHFLFWNVPSLYSSDGSVKINTNTQQSAFVIV